MSKSFRARVKTPERIRVRTASAARLRDNPDVDSSNLKNGSVLVYKSARDIWEATTTLDAQNVEGGEY